MGKTRNEASRLKVYSVRANFYRRGSTCTNTLANPRGNSHVSQVLGVLRGRSREVFSHRCLFLTPKERLRGYRSPLKDLNVARLARCKVLRSLAKVFFYLERRLSVPKGYLKGGRLKGPTFQYFRGRFPTLYRGGSLLSSNFYLLIRLRSVFCFYV